MAQDIYVCAHGRAPQKDERDPETRPLGSLEDVRGACDAALSGIHWESGGLGTWEHGYASLFIDLGEEEPCQCIALKQRGSSELIDEALDAFEARGWFAYLAIFGMWRHHL